MCRRCDEANRCESFDDSLNDAFPTVIIAGLEFKPADILFEMDPVAYRVYKSDFTADAEGSSNE